MFVDLLNAFVSSLSPAKIYANVRDAVNPTLTTTDLLLGYADYSLSYDGKPSPEKMSPGVVYFYKANNKIYFISQDPPPPPPVVPLSQKISSNFKRLGYSIAQSTGLRAAYRYFSGQKTQSNAPILKEKDEKTYFKAKLQPDDISQDVYNELMICLDDVKNKPKLTPVSRQQIYSFLKINQAKVGLKEKVNRIISVPYNKFETNFIAKHPKIYQAYKTLRLGIDYFATFAASQTGIRISGIASAVLISVFSGGIVPASMVGAYAAGIGVSILQESYYKVFLNRLEEEARLIYRYKHNNTKMGTMPYFKKALEETKSKGTIRKWLAASGQYLSTYLFEATIPVATTILYPIGGAITALQMGTFMAISAMGIGAGIAKRKSQEDLREMRIKEIKSLKFSSDIPPYKNINELKQIILTQEIEMQNQALKTRSQEELKQTNFFQEYKKAFLDVINPFKDYTIIPELKAITQDLKDNELNTTPLEKLQFKQNTIATSLTVAAAASITLTGSPVLASSIIGVGLFGSAAIHAKDLYEYKKIKEKQPNNNSQAALKDKTAFQEEISKTLPKIARKQTTKNGIRSLPRERVITNPLSENIEQIIKKHEQQPKQSSFENRLHQEEQSNKKVRGAN